MDQRCKPLSQSSRSTSIMAYVAVTPIQKNIVITIGVAQSLGFNFLTGAGAAYDAHAVFDAKLRFMSSINGQPVEQANFDLIANSTPSFSTPTTTFLFSTTQLNTLDAAI